MQISLFSKTQKIVLVAIAACFFFGASFLAFANVVRPANIHPHFDWPDETMNAFFAKQFADTGTFTAPMLEKTLHDVIRPRSFNVYYSLNDYKLYLVPGGFLGLPYWYGLGLKIFGQTASLFFTPLLATLALLAFAYIMCVVFDRRTAVFATFFAVVNPAWLYYANYSYLPNVPFVSALVCTVAAGIAALRSKLLMARFFWTIVSGISLGIAFGIRTNESLWVALLLCILCFATDVRKHWKTFLGIFVVSMVFFAPMLFWQTLTYGNPFVTGYSRLTQNGLASSPTEFVGATENPLAVAVSALTFPYGIHPRAVWFHVKNYWLLQVPWASFSMILGVIYFCIKEPKSRKKIILLSAAFFSTLWLFVSYGSWMTLDPLTRALNTIGDSHVRYWLPLVFIWTPFLGWSVASLYEKNWIVKILLVVFSATYLACTIGLVYVSVPESIVWVSQRIRAYNNAAAVIVANTEPDAVIIASRTDKEIFPERQVTPGPLTDLDGTIDAFPALYCNHPLYMYAMASDYVGGDLIQALADQYHLFGTDQTQGLFEQIAEPRPNYFLTKIRRVPILDTLCQPQK